MKIGKTSQSGTCSHVGFGVGEGQQTLPLGMDWLLRTIPRGGALIDG